GLVSFNHRYRRNQNLHGERSKRKLHTLNVLSNAPVILPRASRVNRIRLPLPLKRSVETGSNSISFDFSERTKRFSSLRITWYGMSTSSLRYNPVNSCNCAAVGSYDGTRE